MAGDSNSPLRYPGGKAVLSGFLASTIEANTLEDCTYVEPFAGGAGAAINLLFGKRVSRIVLNDADRSVWAFWHSILNRTDEFVELIQSTTISVSEWKNQREIYRSGTGSVLELGFAAFYLNRCNRSGILTNGGVIGGLDQSGKWKIDARFNATELIRRIRQIASHKKDIRICNLDAIEFLRLEVLSEADRSKFFIYLDPPYYVKGSRLYLNYYQDSDHRQLAQFLRKIRKIKWLVTYDNAPEIREMYSWCELVDFKLRYSAATSKQGSEILISSNDLVLPTLKVSKKTA